MTIWLLSDPHFDHARLLQPGEDGQAPCRPEFDTVDQMNDAIKTLWNERVRPGDHGYILGDVTMRRPSLAHVRDLHGRLRLVRGNHDIYRTADYLAAGFEEIHGIRILDGLALTHVPVHRNSLRWRGNIHGHLHRAASPVGPYLNVSAEVLGYAPITLEEAAARVSAGRDEESTLSLEPGDQAVVQALHEELLDVVERHDLTDEQILTAVSVLFVTELAPVLEGLAPERREQVLGRVLDGMRVNALRALSMLVADDAEVVG